MEIASTDSTIDARLDALKAVGALFEFTAERRSHRDIARFANRLAQRIDPGVAAEFRLASSKDTPERPAEGVGAQTGTPSIAAEEIDYGATIPLTSVGRFVGALVLHSPRPIKGDTGAALLALAGAVASAAAAVVTAADADDVEREIESRVELRTAALRDRVVDMETTREAMLNTMRDAQDVHKKLEAMTKNLVETIEYRTHEADAAKEEAIRANQLKSEFLSHVSHELRTPMHGIISFAKIGLKKIESLSTAKHRDYYNQILDSAQELLALINDLLDLSKIEAGRGSYDFAVGDVMAPIRRLLQQYDGMFTVRRLHYALEDRLATPTACFDRDRMYRVLTNLLGNAVKFSPIGGTVEIAASNVEDRVVIEVKDCGPGVPPEDLETIFEPFVQGSVQRGPKGTGLGLAIARNIVRDHGGELVVENRPEGGAVFRVSWPIAGPTDCRRD